MNSRGNPFYRPPFYFFERMICYITSVVYACKINIFFLFSFSRMQGSYQKVLFNNYWKLDKCLFINLSV